MFGNMGETSATGVAFHARSLHRRESVLRRVSDQRPGRGRGRRHPHAAADHRGARKQAGSDKPSMEEALPEAYDELKRIHDKLEQHYRDMQDIEFTVQQGKLYMLQTRNGKRTAAAALRIAVEMAQRRLIDKTRGGVRVSSPASLDQLLHPTLDPDGGAQRLIATGCRHRRARPSGEIVFTADEAEAARRAKVTK